MKIHENVVKLHDDAMVEILHFTGHVVDQLVQDFVLYLLHPKVARGPK